MFFLNVFGMDLYKSVLIWLYTMWEYVLPQVQVYFAIMKTQRRNLTAAFYMLFFFLFELFYDFFLNKQF